MALAEQPVGREHPDDSGGPGDQPGPRERAASAVGGTCWAIGLRHGMLLRPDAAFAGT
jgi:hypothetical protein